MTALETQVGQIFISDRKLSKSFVSLLSEKVPETDAEIYTLIEIPLLNPLAWAEYEKMAKLIQMVLRRNFRRENGNAFENSIAQINDELSKIAANGQTNWIGKMNACLAVRQDETLYISTTGKIHAFLLREKQLSDLADSPEKTNPLKTFENFAAGRVLKKDYLIFTTAQTFNYISIERFKDILNSSSLAAACQNIAEIIKNLADESISFGTFILELGSKNDFGAETILKFSPIKEKKSVKEIVSVSISVFNSAAKKITEKLKITKIPKLNLSDVRPTLIAERAKEMANIQRIRELPRAKKFFLISAAVFSVLLIINIFVAIHVHSQKAEAQKYSAALDDVQKKINDSAYLFNDQQQALALLNQAKSELDSVPDKKDLHQQKIHLKEQIVSLQNNIGGVKTASVSELAQYQNGADRLKLANNKIFFFKYQGSLLISYDTQSKTFGNPIQLNADIDAITTANQNIFYSDKSGALYQVDQQNNSASKLNGQVPANSTGLSLYGSPLKAYAMDKSTNSISSVTADGSAPATSYFKQSVDLSKAIDMAIDGSVYVLSTDGIQKFTSGVQKAFSSNGLSFSDNAKIYADKNLSYVYVLDPGSKKLIIMDKSGKIKSQFTSDKFDDLKDFSVDSTGKNAYILNGNSILQVSLQ